MVGELFSLVVGPENLLGNQIIDTAFFKDLRKRCGVAKGIRQPEHPAVHRKHFLIICLAVQQLADQRLTTRHVCIRLHPHGAFGDPLALFNCLSDFLKQLRIVFPAHLIAGRLALDKFIVLILLHQTQLRRKCPGSLPVRLRHRPQPGQIQMGVSNRGKYRGR